MPLTGVNPSILYLTTSDGLMWLIRQRYQGCIQEPVVFSVTAQLDLQVLELHGAITK